MACVLKTRILRRMSQVSEFCQRCKELSAENAIMKRMLRSTRDALRAIASHGDGITVVGGASATPSMLAKMARHELGKRVAMGEE